LEEWPLSDLKGFEAAISRLVGRENGAGAKEK
jgi:hypothetical protein